jgi:TolB protein
MIRRASFWLLLLIVLGFPFAIAAKTRHSARRPQSTAKPTSHGATAAAAGRIAYIGDDANVFVCARPCDRPTCITCAPKAEHALGEGVTRVALIAGTAQPEIRYNWPTFAPDGSQVAYSSMQHSGGSETHGIHAYDFSRRAAVTIFQGPDQPIYLSWLPDSHRLFFLVSDGESLRLMLAEARESRPVRLILSGLPLYFDWNQRLAELAFHYVPAEGAGPEQIGLMSVTDHDQRVVKIISKAPAPFRNPAWSPDKSHLAYVVDRRNGQMALVVANADGSSPREMVGLGPRDTSFIWTPDSRRLAFATQMRVGSMSYDGVNLVDIASGNITTLVSEPVIAYNFSPDGRWLAYIGVTEDSNTWNVVEAGGGKGRKLGYFVASHTESVAYRVFDQYALSHRIWSPDSSAVVFAGTILKEGVALPSGAAPPPSVWLLPMDGGPAQTLADGDVAFWSPVP